MYLSFRHLFSLHLQADYIYEFWILVRIFLRTNLFKIT